MVVQQYLYYLIMLWIILPIILVRLIKHCGIAFFPIRLQIPAKLIDPMGMLEITPTMDGSLL